MSPARPRTLTRLGVTLTPLPIGATLARIAAAIRERRSLVVANHNLHSAALHRSDAPMRAFYEQAEIILIDGMPILRWAQLTGSGLDDRARVTWLDHLDDVLRFAVRCRWRVVHVGGLPDVAPVAQARLRERHPGLDLICRDGYFTFPSPEADAVVSELHHLQPHVLLIGMGMPRQESFILRYRAALPPCVMITCGATCDYIAGVIPTAPRWLGRLGLEWAFRLLSEPRRLAHRYLVEPWRLLPELYRDLRPSFIKRRHNAA